MEVETLQETAKQTHEAFSDPGYINTRPRFAKGNNIDLRIKQIKKSNISVKRPVLNLNALRIQIPD
jgi:hypothetical protein